MAVGQPLQSSRVIHLQIPALVQQWRNAKPDPAPDVAQQIIALRHDQRNVTANGKRGADGLIRVAVKAGGVRDFLLFGAGAGGAAASPSPSNVSSGAPCGRGIPQAIKVWLLMEALHGDKHGQARPELVDNLLGDLALPGAWCPG